MSAKERARRVAVVPQEAPVPTGLTVREMVALGRTPYARLFLGPTAEDRQAIDWAMAAAGIEALSGRFVDELSGGERQRHRPEAGWPSGHGCCSWTAYRQPRFAPPPVTMLGGAHYARARAGCSGAVAGWRGCTAIGSPAARGGLTGRSRGGATAPPCRSLWSACWRRTRRTACRSIGAGPNGSGATSCRVRRCA
jgi:hypothetical protein